MANMSVLSSLLCLLAIVSIAFTSPATHVASGASSISFSVGIPTSVAKADKGTIYFQIRAPSSYQWVAMGIGAQMANAKIFVMYADGTGNVTISARAGKGHVMPLFDSSPNVELIAGSGVINNEMIANVAYKFADGTLSTTSTKSSWIGAWHEGTPLNSKSVSASISKHDEYDQYNFDLTQATITTDANPFVTSASSPVETGKSDAGSNSSDSAAPPYKIYETIHGVLMGLSFAVLFPSGAIIMGLWHNIWIHGAVQMLAIFCIIAAFGIGLVLAADLGYNFSTTHTIFGLIVFVLLMLQPALGFLHHRQYKQLGYRSYFGHIHIWYGRALMVAGAFNGGLGIQLAGNSKTGLIIYAIVAAAMFFAYICAWVIGGMRKNKKVRGVGKRSAMPLQPDSYELLGRGAGGREMPRDESQERRGVM